MYWLNYLDRNAIALAKLDTIDADLKLTDTRRLNEIGLVGHPTNNHMQSTKLVSQSSSSVIFSEVSHQTC